MDLQKFTTKRVHLYRWRAKYRLKLYETARFLNLEIPLADIEERRKKDD